METVLVTGAGGYIGLNAAEYEENIDYVVHVAARASDVGRDEWFREANYEAVKNLASAAMERGVKRFAYLSTADVYVLHDFSNARMFAWFDKMGMEEFPEVFSAPLRDCQNLV